METLRRVAEHTDVDWHIYIVDDASTDPEVTPILIDWVRANDGQVTLLRNKSNIGFVGSVNIGLKHAVARRCPVVLLNSDAWVPANWASRIFKPFASPDVASVTPMSNNAELCTVPAVCKPIEMFRGEADIVDEQLGKLGGDFWTEAPTGVGFCMALSPTWLDKLPQFDSAFGKGYGEEVDWCQRIRKFGGRHVVHHRLLVEHAGSASFGEKCRADSVAKSNAVISRRYPSFDLDVQDFIRSDPLLTVRFFCAVALASLRENRLTIFVGHSMGGGAEIALQKELDTFRDRNAPFLVLRVGGAMRWILEIYFEETELVLGTERFEEIEALLRAARNLHVIYSCGVGAKEPTKLPQYLLRISQDRPVSLRIHDYFLVSPSIFLTQADGWYRGVPEPEDNIEADKTVSSTGRVVTLSEWRENWGQLIARATEIRVFSESSSEIFATAYPLSKPKILVKPHRLHKSVPSLNLSASSKPGRIGTLGNLSVPKGAHVLSKIADASAQIGGPELVLLGRIDPIVDVSASLIVHGGYKLEEISKLASEYGIQAWLIPSVCPETFSFATHEALATGLTTIGFDIGAQGEALRKHPNGICLPYRPEDFDPRQIAVFLEELMACRRAAGDRAA